MLQLSSFHTMQITSGMDSTTRDRLATDWNSPASKWQALVLNTSISSAGLNLQGCCCRGIFIPLVWNAGTMLQAHGRLVRLGQKQPVVWTQLRVNATIFDWMELRYTQKVSVPRLDLQVG